MTVWYSLSSALAASTTGPCSFAAPGAVRTFCCPAAGRAAACADAGTEIDPRITTTTPNPITFIAAPLLDVTSKLILAHALRPCFVPPLPPQVYNDLLATDYWLLPANLP